MVKLFLPDWVMLFCNIEDGINISNLSKKINVTYKTALGYVKLLLDLKYIECKQTRQEQQIYLTEKGRKKQLICCKFYEEFN